MASTGRHGGGGGGRGGGGRGRGGRGRFGRGGRVFVSGPSFYGYGYGYPYGYDWQSYYARVAQQQAYLQYLQQLAAAYAQPQYAAVPGASAQVAQLRASIDRLTQELAGIENALSAAAAGGGGPGTGTGCAFGGPGTGCAQHLMGAPLPPCPVGTTYRLGTCVPGPLGR